MTEPEGTPPPSEPDFVTTEVIPEEVIRKRSGCGRALSIASLVVLAIVVWETASLTSDNGTCRLRDYSISAGAASATGLPAGDIAVMTYNTEGHAVLLNRKHVQEIAETINDVHPDIVGLQEVHMGTLQSRFVDQPAELEKLTGLHGRFGSSFHFMGGEFGNAILTRGEILSTRVYARREYLAPREDGVPELAAHEVEAAAETAVETGEFFELRRLIDEAGLKRPHVHLLKADDIRMHVVDRLGDFLDMLAVQEDCVALCVVGHDRDIARGQAGRRRRSCADRVVAQPAGAVVTGQAGGLPHHDCQHNQRRYR